MVHRAIRATRVRTVQPGCGSHCFTVVSSCGWHSKLMGIQNVPFCPYFLFRVTYSQGMLAPFVHSNTYTTSRKPVKTKKLCAITTQAQCEGFQLGGRTNSESEDYHNTVQILSNPNANRTSRSHIRVAFFCNSRRQISNNV